MAPTTKEAQRAELHKTIWRIANDLRGSVDGWDFKAYVLGMLFYRFISENLTAYINQGEHEAGNPDYDYAEESDHLASGILEGIVEEKGFFILPSELFANVRERAPRDEKLNETLLEQAKPLWDEVRTIVATAPRSSSKSSSPAAPSWASGTRSSTSCTSRHAKTHRCP
ncbi:MAG: type I restriction-modification system subunit M N-terminal domain-containing protein [Propionibacteriaceae bacterium]|nr:type I restriction-modification system subunit M N-terminal domain-containing protein [Propionibacteriaceae bacterium]